MRQNVAVLTVLMLIAPSLAFAHMRVTPRESLPGAEEAYTVPVPTEGQVATAPWTPGTTLTNARATPAPPASAAACQVATAQTAKHPVAPTPGDTAVIEQWLNEYDAAFNAKDLDKLGTFYHPEATIYEGGRVDHGWASYRDGHLGPELKAFEPLQFGHGGRKIHLLGDGKSAYVVSTYTLKARMGERSIDSSGLETLVLVQGDDARWKIRHSHTSSRPRRPAQ